MVDQALVDFLEWSVNLAFWGALAFPVVMAFVWPWWRDWYGQTTVMFDMCLAGAALGLVLSYDLGVKLMTAYWIDAFSLALSFAIMIWRGVMIYRIQRRPPAE